jgi:hypothetical protein
MARRRSRPSKPTETPSAPTTTEPAPLNSHPKAEVSRTDPDHSKFVDELERDLDRILFRIMSAGGMPELERQIRLCRRLLILGSGSGSLE